MQVSFFLPLEPFSVNRMYSRDRRYKTADFKDWELAAVQTLAVPTVQKKLKELREYFDAKKHAFVVKFDFQYPANILYNKAGEVSSRAEDLSNIEKGLLDILFLPKYHVQGLPYGCPNINADDKHVLRLISSKTASKDGKHWIKIAVRIVAHKPV